MAQPVGLVVEPVVLNRLGIFPESATTVLADWQQRLEQLLEDQPVGDQAASEQWLSVAPSFELFCQEVLAWQPGDLRQPEELAAPVAVTLDDYDEVLRPNWIVGEPSQGDGPLKAQLLVQVLPVGTPFDALPKGADGRRCWEATPQQRLERLLKESEHPWLGPFGQEACVNGKGSSYANRLLVRSASNAYFPELISAISIPESIDGVREVISKHLKAFEKITSAAKLEVWLEDYAPDHIKDPLAGTAPAEIFEALEAIRGGEAAPEKTEALKRQELRALVGPIAGLQRGTGNSRFEAEQLDLATKPAWFRQRINRVVKVHQLREVMALLGFTRLEPVVSQIDGDPLDLGVKRAKIDVKEEAWLPAVENLGEGIFLSFDPDAIRSWLNCDGVKQHLSKHRDAFKIWNKEHGLTEEKFQWPGGAYLMLHSLAHLLITEAALDCGYGASAIKERIYAFDNIGYGILLYTGGSGSEGSLGGLVGLADFIDELLATALERAALCSNDPFCASHEPNSELEKRYAHGAACHGCLLIAETSCERRNEFLDRALVVPTLIQQDAAFFTAGR